MDSTLVIAITVVVLTWLLVRPRRGAKLPPGPYPLPIIGNILQLSRKSHRSLTDLSKRYGPLMSLRMGSVHTIVVSSPEYAKLVLQEHDQLFSCRTIPAAAEVHGFDKISVALIPVGEEWKKLRKLYREQLLSARRLEAGEGLRREKLRKLNEYVQRCGVSGRAVNLGEAAFVTSLNLLTVTLFSADFAEFDSGATQNLKKVLEGVTKSLGVPNVADFFPLLKRWDPQGIRRRSEFHIGKLLGVIQGIMEERLESRSLAACERKNDVLDTLMDSMEGDDYDLSFRDIQHLLLDLFIAASETIPITVEWAMTELLVNPKKMSRAKNELRTVIGENNQVEESDISRLPYLQALIKETFRLHPPGPFLVPRRADSEVEIRGYTIPRNAQILINIWAIGRDPNAWENPSVFEPERFLDSKIEYKGKDFELLPFGSGRRVCPGLPLAGRMLPLVLGSLIHNFEWKLEKGEEIDTTEEFGLALRKALPLKAIPVVRV